MNPLDRTERYLAIPPRYGAELGGLWWSSRRDAIERRDGTTLAVADEVRAVLEGALAHPAAPAFAFVLNLLHRLKTGGEPGFDTLHKAYVATRGTAARGRNVGLLIARLCSTLPWVPGSITFENVTLALRSLRLYGPHTPPDFIVDEPPLTRDEFEQHVAQLLARYSEERLVHWLTYGQSPGEGGQRLAEQAETLPERVARLLGVARKRARLVGAASLVPALDAALALPPRGRPPEALPLGGYCDVTTRGGPERLLPGQFALDPDEFVRRFAANELLYFKREEPHAAVRPDRVIVLDQGVRTWGSVRLALAAAALSLLKVDPKRCGTVQLFATSNGTAVHLLHPNPDAVVDGLEASDLTPHPGACLAKALDAGEGEPRDVILLTHPRSLREPEVMKVAAEHAPNDRLFAVTVDESGRAELSQWAASGAVPVRAFRVDLEAAEAARPEGEVAPKPRPRSIAVAGAWSGDVEPVPFPFRPGIVSEPAHFGFDADEGRLAAAGRDGVLHSLAFDGSPAEVLPRAFRNGAVLKQVDAVLGVNGGFVVCGRMVVGSAPTVAAPAPRAVTIHVNNIPTFSSTASPPAVTEQFVAAHYDRATRHVTLHTLGPVVDASARWSAHPDLHCIAVRASGNWGCALDLGTLGRFPYPGAPVPTLISRACLAWDRAANGTAPHELPVGTGLPAQHSLLRERAYVLLNGTLHLQHAELNWPAISPVRDGKPLLAGADPRRAQLAGDTLALSYASAGASKLLLLRDLGGTVLGEVGHPLRNAFGLSADGRLLARCDTTHGVVVSTAADPSRAIATAPHAALHNGLSIELEGAPFRLTITVSVYRHTFQLEDGALLYKSRWEATEQTEPPKSVVRHAPTDYDPVRFPVLEAVRAGGWVAVLDRLGQVLLYRGENGPLVAVFLVRRERAAAWTPAGAFWGDPRLIGAPATPDAGKKVGRAITDAEGDRGSTVPAGSA